jgi:hypothetical protein
MSKPKKLLNRRTGADRQLFEGQQSGSPNLLWHDKLAVRQEGMAIESNKKGAQLVASQDPHDSRQSRHSVSGSRGVVPSDVDLLGCRHIGCCWSD